MSPDARLIALAVLYAAPDCLDAQTATDRLEALMNRLPQQEPQPGIRGMVPVAWVNQMLDELFSVAAQVTPQPVPVAEKIISIRTQLTQFQGDA